LVEEFLKFSVVIPLYNKEKHIQRAIRSVLGQTYPHFELIIVDDGSTDGSYEAARVIEDPRIRIIRQENRGVSAARNRGVEEAKFEWVAFLDADDEWLPEFLTAILDLQEEFPDCGLYASSYEIIRTGDETTFPNMAFAGGKKVIIEDIFRDFHLYGSFNSSSVVIKKENIIKFGGFPNGISRGEDIITWMRLFEFSKFALINLHLSRYYLNSDNRACNKFSTSLEIFPPVIYLLDKLKNKEILEKYRHSALEYIAQRQINLAKRQLRNNLQKEALQSLWSCRFTHAYRVQWNKILIKTIISYIYPSIIKRA